MRIRLQISKLPKAAFLITGVWALMASASPTSAANLVGYWNFDNSSNVGQAQVSSDLQTFGNVGYTANGKLGGGFLDDGSGYLAVDSGFSLATGMPTGNGSYTLMAWILPALSDNRYGIIGWGDNSNYNDNAFRTGASGEELVNYAWGGPGDISTDQAQSIYDGSWHNVAVTYDASLATKKLYLDGVLIQTLSSVPTLNVSADHFAIGTTPFGENFDGILDEVKVYDGALSQPEIQTAMAVPEPGVSALTAIGALAFGLLRRRRRD